MKGFNKFSILWSACWTAVIAAAIGACSQVPVTGRSQLSLVSSQEMLSMSTTEYSNFIKTNKVAPSTDKQAQMVRKVGQNIQFAVEKYFREHNLSGNLSGYKWEYNLVESKEVNAWCMPGGKVVVYTGILPITKNDTGLAVVLGHEIAHAVAEHGKERMSQGMIAQLGGMALDQALEQKSAETKQIWMTAYGLGAQYGVLMPYGRTQESEADHLGLIFMAMAGYDPHAALTFWQRMAAQGGSKPPEILSTHPSDETRIADISKRMPEAMTYYHK